MADSRLISGLSTSAAMAVNCCSLDIGRQVLAVGKRADAERIAVGGQHRHAFADVFGRGAVHDRAGRVSSCQVPLPGVITNELEPPSRAMPAWNEASVRSDGFMNSSPSTLPRQRMRLGLRAPDAAPASSSSEQLSREKSARSMNRRMAAR